MTVAAVQTIGSVDAGSSSTTTTVISVSKTITAGNTIVVGWGAYDAVTLSSVTDNLGNTYTVVESPAGVTGAVSAIAVARITTGGSLTTITCNHGSTRYRFAAAAEYSGCGTTKAAGGGTSSAGSASPGTWVSNKTIPVGGAAFGVLYVSASSKTFSAGSSSGSPSTAISVQTQLSSANNSLGLFHALAGAAPVTSFSGTGDWSGSTQWAGAGATITGGKRDPMGMSGFFGV